MSVLTNPQAKNEALGNPANTAIVTDAHAKHSAIREALEHVGDKLKQHRIDAEEARRKKAEANLASEKSEEQKRKVEAEQRLAHEQKLADIRKVEAEVSRLKGERFKASLLGRTLSVVGRATAVTGKAIAVGGIAGYKAIEKFGGSSRGGGRRKKSRPKKRKSSRDIYNSSPNF